nr:thiamine pyrophosphate enzyme [Raoultella sp. NCTC 9187]
MAAPTPQLNDAIAQALPDDGILVRDITVSGSLWGSRLFRAHGPLMNIHSLAGAIGMGLRWRSARRLLTRSGRWSVSSATAG